MSAKAFSTLAVTICAALAAGSAELSGNAPPSIIPPFVAEGRLSTRSFRTERTNLNYNTDANVFFLYSNGWWQVEVQYSNPGRGPSIDNCMKIPDGTRTYTLFGGDTRTGMTTASACPTTFPPPG